MGRIRAISWTRASATMSGLDDDDRTLGPVTRYDAWEMLGRATMGDAVLRTCRWAGSCRVAFTTDVPLSERITGVT
jgi:hypothetical protein